MNADFKSYRRVGPPPGEHRFVPEWDKTVINTNLVPFLVQRSANIRLHDAQIWTYGTCYSSQDIHQCIWKIRIHKYDNYLCIRLYGSSIRWIAIEKFVPQILELRNAHRPLHHDQIRTYGTCYSSQGTHWWICKLLIHKYDKYLCISLDGRFIRWITIENLVP